MHPSYHEDLPSNCTFVDQGDETPTSCTGYFVHRWSVPPPPPPLDDVGVSKSLWRHRTLEHTICRTEWRGCRHLVGFATLFSVSTTMLAKPHKVSTNSQVGSPTGVLNRPMPSRRCRAGGGTPATCVPIGHTSFFENYLM